MIRRDKINYYLDLAEVTLERGTCIRRNYGAVIVKNDEVISTGYTGAPRDRQNCSDIGKCARQILNIKSGEHYELCRSVHAEQNAIISASRKDMIGATLYLVGKDATTNQYVDSTSPCAMCKRVIINAGISLVVARINKKEYTITKVESYINYDEVLDKIQELLTDI